MAMSTTSRILLSVYAVWGLSGTQRAAAQQPSSHLPYKILGDTANAPAGCSAEVAAARFEELLQAISDGRKGITETFFGGKNGAPIFWYALSDMRAKRRFADYGGKDKDSLKTHFDSQTRAPEVLHLTRYFSNGWEKNDETYNLLLNSFNAEFEARNRTTGAVTGYGFVKGGYYCDSKGFHGMSLGLKDKYQRLTGRDSSQ